MKTYRRKRKPENEVKAEPRVVRNPEAYREKMKARRRRSKIILCLILLVAVMAGVMFTPLFNISGIEVKGTSVLTAEEVISTGRIFKGDNIWFMRKGRAEKLIGKLSYVDKVSVERKLPGKVIINVQEYVPYAYLTVSKNSHIIIARNGIILENAKKAPTGIKELRGIKPASTKVGQLFIEKGTLVGKSYESTLSRLEKYGYEDGVKYIQIKNEDIRFKYNNLVVILGDTTSMDYKFSFVKTCLTERGEDVEGCFDISVPEVAGYYKENFDENAKLITKTEREKMEAEAAEKEKEEAEKDSEEQ